MPSIFGSLSPYEPEPAEIAAQRMRQAVKSPRQEGTATKVLDSYVPHVAQGLADILTFPGQYAQNYQPGQMAAADPSATDWAAGTALGMVGTPGAPAGTVGSGIKAYHGSPHSFERFDNSKIGTGEGAQSYGHGLYFAENEAVAADYKRRLTQNSGSTSIETPYRAGEIDNSPRSHERFFAARFRENRGDLNNTISQLEGDLTNHPTDKTVQMALDFAKHPDAKFSISEFNPGHMYEVGINAEPEKFLDWDNPLSQQSPHVTSALKSVLKDTNRMPEEWIKSSPGAEDRLREAGIPGIKYFDQGSRNFTVRTTYKGEPYSDPVKFQTKEQAEHFAAEKKAEGFGADVAQEGTRNFSVFDPSIVEILRKYGIAGLTGGVGAAAASSQLPAKFGSLSPQE